ncbi:MAG: helix-turn-helix domain-containing protein [Myxococcaceae bacterium]|nr:helix-turn-helix domain-containing protein [Myxococcaceae bacterium]
MSPSWVYQAAARGVLPTVKLGRALRFDELALRRWLDAQTPRPTVMGLNLRGR